MNKLFFSIAGSLAMMAVAAFASAAPGLFKLDTTGTFKPYLPDVALRVRSGSSISVTTAITSRDDFAGAVAVALAPRTPPGITMAPMDVAVGAGRTVQSTLTLKVAPDMARGEHVITVQYQHGTQHQDLALRVSVLDIAASAALSARPAP
jgi:hypothetical protein